MSNELKERVLMILRDNVDDPGALDAIGMDDDLSVLGINSMTFIKLVLSMEMEFGVSWDDEELDFQHFSTINNIIRYLSQSTVGEGA
ncbi:acyl carrier protein [Xylanibacillus composti]|uniref:Carrier domain-containing protein n=1 Tax=Xylanibacillus composti TaxID=1572762 RepID=A0A8J4H6R0_9BACL|nr:acyl carrier protein [Xylanibacillus composti]GIQ69513.1 hypothetical protein XYCOK13_23370 [Xylanibacillus composti]